ncbi:hypothetical protein BDF14DRAFT_1867871 [Spinellus fusiger]|nr:hypothetical protein BDF14DRAFT_1867871 [Spinellus fusiger]
MPFVLNVRLWILFFLCSFLPTILLNYCLPSLTCLELPLSEIWQERQAGFTPRSGFSKSLVKDFFTYNTSQESTRLPVLPFCPVWTCSCWISFWVSPIYHSSCSIWYCTLHSKLSCCLVLYQIVPLLFPDTVCPICLASEDHPAHFLFLCSNKLSVWQEM